MRYSQTKTCSNCGLPGHSFRQCLSPVTSHGVIAVRVCNGWNPSKILAEQETSFTGLETASPLQFLLIQRKDSLGFVELMRGKYEINDYNYIKIQMKGMTNLERERLLTKSFLELWCDLWGADHNSSQYKNEKETSRLKFEELRANGLVDETGTRRPLRDIFDRLGPGWQTPEWGFPKGRRDPNETERACALREMWEETGLRTEDVTIIENCEPVQETFFGTNNVHYCHKYKIVYVDESVVVKFDENNEHMKREIGGLGWFPLEEALEKIRNDNVEKKEVLLRVCSLFRNYCPLVTGKFKRSE